jgi:hypothetical protein
MCLTRGNDKNESDLYSVSYRPALIIGSQPNVSLRVSVENRQEPAFLAHAVISLPAPCSLVYFPHSCKILDDVNKPASVTELKCPMGNPLAGGKEVSFLLCCPPY